MPQSKENTSQGSGRLSSVGLANLFVVYVVWSSTYLAIRIAVQEGAGFPPFTLGFMRAAIAGVVLILWTWLQKKRVRLTREEIVILAVSGILLWVGGNGLVTFAETRAESGLAALLVSASPIWAAGIEAILDRKWPSLQLSVSLLIGFAGIAVLTIPQLSTGIHADTIAILALVVAPITWASGSVFQARNPVSLQPRVSSAYQMLFGAIGFLLLIWLMGEPLPTPTQDAWIAFVYLVVIGSLFAFTSYVIALQLLPTRIVMTYAYVNPVLAVILGRVVLGEEITLFTIGGTVLVLLGVAGVFRERRKLERANISSRTV